MDTLCKIRDIYRGIAEFESQFQKMYDLSLNEGMLLCTISKEGKCTSGELARLMALSNSNTSKVIKSVEEKGLIERLMGECDKRQMCFSLTKDGLIKLHEIKCEVTALPPILQNVLRGANGC
ncbi:MAG: MarR family transcriptional regulator [Rikenellaceae bacterium]